MPMCKRCKSTVSKQYAEVMWGRTDVVPACPDCDDAKISNGSLHEYRGQ